MRNPEKYYLNSKEDMIQRTKRNSMERNILNYLSSSESYFSMFNDKSALDYGGQNLQCSTAIIKEQQATVSNYYNNATYLKMNDSSMYEFYCSHVHCNVGPLNTDDTAMIRFRFRLWSKSLSIVRIFFFF